ncbi:M56 family metallopeptidase [Pseudolysobacter antarcticus]|uniref:M56 family metallopeptidase n=1 Tax=Pseudolysobacter antarcticus TaxID=2511995 RepID=A0A411HMY7_9GAMM|nr:M56 family metallopeptidase [Pseudolysobacter antarcticus]QBB71836.1 M56 family metallopeptidase [Pseudolysobacter antarcticus]
MIDVTHFVAWLLTVAMHAMLLLACAWLLDTTLKLRLAWRELLWRSALFGGALTASIAFLPIPLPTALRFAVHGVTPVSTTVATRVRASSDIQHKPKAASDLQHVAMLEQAPQRATKIGSAPIDAQISASVSSWQIPHVLILPLLSLWLAGALMQLARLLRAEWQLRQLLCDAHAVHDLSATDMLDTLADAAGRSAPRLFELDHIDSPFAIGHYIVLPRWARLQWSRAQLQAALAHEFAHLQRRDPRWRRIIAIWQSLLWFVPLTHLARRRIEECAELACDAAAARAPNGAHALAECLVACLQQRSNGHAGWSPAAAMAQRRSPLMQRVDQLLEGAPMNTLRTGWLGACLVTTLLMGFSMILPGLQFAHADVPTPPAVPVAPKPPTAPKAHVSGAEYHISIDDDHTLIRTRDRQGTLDVRINGKVSFNESENDIESLTGTASIEQDHDGNARRIEYRLVDGAIERRYWLHDHEQALDADARAWLAQVIPAVLRSGGFDAEARVQRFLKRGGVAAVLAEIALIDSDSGRSRYIIELSKQTSLRGKDLDQVLDLTAAIGSDYEKRQALQTLFTQQKFDDALLAHMLTLVGDVSSDYERAELLVAVAPQSLAGHLSRAAWMTAVAGISSDYEHRRTLEALLKNVRNDDVLLRQILAGAESISSDYERRSLVQSVLQHVDNADTIAPAYLQAARNISSDYEHREALTALINAPGFGKVSASGILDDANSIGSDYEASRLLKELIERMPGDADLITRCHAAAARLSDHERKEVERALQSREV